MNSCQIINQDLNQSKIAGSYLISRSISSVYANGIIFLFVLIGNSHIEPYSDLQNGYFYLIFFICDFLNGSFAINATLLFVACVIFLIIISLFKATLFLLQLSWIFVFTQREIFILLSLNLLGNAVENKSSEVCSFIAFFLWNAKAEVILRYSC